MQEPRKQWIKHKQFSNWPIRHDLFANPIAILTSAFSIIAARQIALLAATVAAISIVAVGTSACLADPSQVDAHDDFWQYIKEVDRMHELKERDDRREEDLARQMEDRVERRAMAAKRQPLYGDVKSSRHLDFGVGDNSLGSFGGDKIVGADDIFGKNKDKTGGADYMTSQFSKSDGLDDSVSPSRMSPLRKKIAHADDSDAEAADPRTDEWKHLLGINYDIGDWAPSPLDLLDNGGFTHHKDNGRPVPYRLNGHIDENRGVPWAKDD